jgi:hypothetical protein
MILHVWTVTNAVPEIVLIPIIRRGHIQVNVVEGQRAPPVPQIQIVALISNSVVCPEHVKKMTQQNYLSDLLVVKVANVVLEFVITINVSLVRVMVNHVFPGVSVVTLIFIREVVVVIIILVL